MRLGEFDPPEMNPYSLLDLSIIQSETPRNLSVEAAMKSFVLMKNQQILSLKILNYKKVAIVVPMTNNTQQQLGDYSPDINPKYTSTPLVSVTSIWSTARYATGCDDNNLIFACLGTGTDIESEGNDTANLDLQGQQLKLLRDAVKTGQASGAQVILLLFTAGPLNTTWAVDNPEVDAIMELFFPAQATGEALRKVLLVEGPNSVPAGRLPISWPRYMDMVPDLTNYSMVERTYRYATYPVLFPFGYGLSYTSFFYDMLECPSQVTAGDSITGSFSFRNRGSLDADEVDWSDESIITSCAGCQQLNARPDVGSSVLSLVVKILGQTVLGRY